MRLKSMAFLNLFIVLLISLAGCASGGSTHFSQALDSSLSGYNTVVVAVKSNVANTDALVMQIEGAILAALKNQGKFSKVSSSIIVNATDMVLKITVTITEVRDVNTFDRVMLGALAGQGKMYADVELAESPSGKILAKGLIEGKTSGGSIFAGTTPEAADRVAEEVVKLVSLK